MNNGSGILDIERERLIALTIFESKNGIFVCNKQNCIIRVNQAFTDLTGYTFEDVVDRNPNILASGRHHQVFYKAMWNDINQYGAWEGEITNKKKEGVFFLEYLCITVVKDNTGEILNYIGTFTDITTVQKAALEIQRLAFYDPLTGLANRLLLRDRLKQALIQSKRDAKKGAILFIDLDNFKVINDTKGHDKGDILLKQIAIRLEDCVRSCDTVARIGGDEFVIIINSSSVYSVNEVEEQAEIVGKKVLSIFTQDFDLNGC
jgi:diguanylate cyclase (GGDEF)-like protein/PAS domain S-box-containing protein